MDILGALTPEPLIVADRHRAAPTFDAEVKTLLLLPPGTEVAGDGPLPSSATSQPDACSVRSARDRSGERRRLGCLRPRRPGPEKRLYGYVGLAQYRHLEEDPDE